ncbi:mRNA 3'-end-processing protein rna14 [Cryptotrichosporon argae]
MGDNPAHIINELQTLTDIEGDLAETALAVASAPAVAEAGSADGAVAASPGEASAGVDALLESAAAMESVLEQSIPSAPEGTEGTEGTADAIVPVPEPSVAVAELIATAVPDAVGAGFPSDPPLTAAALQAKVAAETGASTSSPAESLVPSAAAPVAESSHSPAAEARRALETVAADLPEPILPDAVLSTAPDIKTEAPSSDTAPSQDGNVAVDATSVAASANGPGGTHIFEETKPRVEEAMQVDVDSGPANTSLPDGLSLSSPSVQGNPGAVDAWRRDHADPDPILVLFDWSVKRTEAADARVWYEALAEHHPTAFKPLSALINLELALDNFAQAEALFARALSTSSTLMAAADVNIWKAYLHYIRRQNPSDGPEGQKARATVYAAYEVALKEVGLDKDSSEIWQEYLGYINEAPAQTPWDTQQKTDLLRKTYTRAVCIPLNNVEALWKAYDAFEGTLNKTTSKKFLADRSPAYMTARTALRELRNLSDAIPHPAVPPHPDYSDDDRRVVHAWRAYLKWEEGNPLAITEPEALVARVGYAMKKCLTEMRHFPEMWFHAANYYKEQGKDAESTAFLRAGVKACPKSFLLTFALAELDEERRDYASCHAIFEDLVYLLNADIDTLKADVAAEIEAARGPEILASAHAAEEGDELARLIREREERGEDVAQRRAGEVVERATAASVVWIMYMRFARRAEGIKGARAVFAKARKSAHNTWHTFEASAMVEYHANKDAAVAIRVFEVGLKQFADDVDYVLAYLTFLLSVNDDTNARALFERTAARVPAERARALWDTWARYEYTFGDLAAVRKLEARWAEAFPNDSSLRRFAQRFTHNGIDEIARFDLGQARREAAHAAHARQPHPPPAAPQAAPAFPVQPPAAAAAAPVFAPPPPRVATPVETLKRDRRDSVGSPAPSVDSFASHGAAGAHKRPRPHSPPPQRYGPGAGAFGPGHGLGSGPGAAGASAGAGPTFDQRAPPAYGPRAADRDARVSSRDRAGFAPPMRERSPPRRERERYPAAAASLPPPLPRDDRMKPVAWFVDGLPPMRRFDGPVFRPDDIMRLFDNIAPSGHGHGHGAPGRAPPPPGGAGGYGPPPPQRHPEPERYGRGPPPRRF